MDFRAKSNRNLDNDMDEFEFIISGVLYQEGFSVWDSGIEPTYAIDSYSGDTGVHAVPVSVTISLNI